MRGRGSPRAASGPARSRRPRGSGRGSCPAPRPPAGGARPGRAAGSAPARLRRRPAARRRSTPAWPTQVVSTGGPDELHRVVDREHRGDRAAGGVEVEVDRRVGALGLEVQQLGDDRVGDAVVDLGAEVDDPVGEQPAVDVDGPLAARRSAGRRRGSCSCSSRDPQPDRRGDARGRTSSTRRRRRGRRSRSRSASSALNQRSRRESRSTVSTGWPVSSAISASTVSRVWRRSSAWISMSIAVPPMPAEPWCSRTRACGSAYRLPGVPADSRNCPALAAIPIASVPTSLGISRITSRIASIAEHRAAGGVDPEADVGARVLGREQQQLVHSRLPLPSSSASPSTTMRWCSSWRVSSSSSRCRSSCVHGDRPRYVDRRACCPQRICLQQRAVSSPGAS